MQKENIESTLRERFSAPLGEYCRRRIVFWKDSEKSFDSLFDEIELDGVKKFRLTGKNNFEAKKLFLADDINSNYLVYDPVVFEREKDDWLLDIRLANETFSADMMSMRLADLGIPQSQSAYKAMRMYSAFFNSRERTEKLKRFGSDLTNIGQLHIDIAAVLAGTEDNTVFGVTEALLSSDLDTEKNEVIRAVERFGNLDAFYEMISRFSGFVFSDRRSLLPLAEHILLSAFSVTAPEALLKGLENRVSEAHAKSCYAFADGWMRSQNSRALYDLCRAVEQACGLVSRFGRADVEMLLSCDIFPCINECILHTFMTEACENVVRVDLILKTADIRRTMKWYEPVRNYFDGMVAVAEMRAFEISHSGGFHYAEPKELWAAYIKELYLPDMYYRNFQTAFMKSLRQGYSEIGDLFKSVSEYVENIYKNRFLSEIGTLWSNLSQDDLAANGTVHGIKKQRDFYSEEVLPLSENGRVYVIVSDALRYEVAARLAVELNSGMSGSASVDAVFAELPSVTKTGMAALLPHKKLELTEDMSVLCDGEATDGTAARERILRSAASESIAITYNDFLSLKKNEKRDKVGKAKIVYIYHNRIDAIGESPITENSVFEACETAIDDLKNLVRVIVNDLSGTNILITADHGFIYTYMPLSETEKVSCFAENSVAAEIDKRFIIATADGGLENLMRVCLKNLNTRFLMFAPREYVRIKNAGGGQRYVHGGTSLQEVVIPVLTYKNIRRDSKKFVDITVAELQLISRSRKINNGIFSVDLFQKQPVEGKTVAGVYDIFLVDSSGKEVSDRQSVIADRQSKRDEERTFRVRLTLKSVQFDKNAIYYLTVAEREGNAEPVRTEFSVDIAFSGDFDF